MLAEPGPYQVQAAISALHAEAPTAEATDWRQIAALYGTLSTMIPSVVVEVNQAVAVAMAHGAQAGLQMLERLNSQAEGARQIDGDARQVDGYYPYHAARADLLRRTNQREAAAEAYERALALCGNPAERAYLQRRLDEMLNLDLNNNIAPCGRSTQQLRAQGLTTSQLSDHRGQKEMTIVQVRYIVNNVDAAISFYCKYLGCEDMHPTAAFAILSRRPSAGALCAIRPPGGRVCDGALQSRQVEPVCD
jgi:hypothetical protein